MAFVKEPAKERSLPVGITPQERIRKSQTPTQQCGRKRHRLRWSVCSSRCINGTACLVSVSHILLKGASSRAGGPRRASRLRPGEPLPRYWCSLAQLTAFCYRIVILTQRERL